MKPADYLTYYVTKFDTVEIDSTFYHAPSAATVNGGVRKTPENFIFAVRCPKWKMPQGTSISASGRRFRALPNRSLQAHLPAQAFINRV